MHEECSFKINNVKLMFPAKNKVAFDVEYVFVLSTTCVLHFTFKKKTFFKSSIFIK